MRPREQRKEKEFQRRNGDQTRNPRAASPVAELFSGRGNGATVPEPLALEELGPKIA